MATFLTFRFIFLIILNRKSEFIIYQFIINDTLVYPLGGGGEGAMMNI
jgi:hypothetical protein